MSPFTSLFLSCLFLFLFFYHETKSLVQVSELFVAKNVAKDDAGLLISLPLPLDARITNALPHSVHGVLGIEPKALCILGKLLPRQEMAENQSHLFNIFFR